jgi:hypothetical protein
VALWHGDAAWRGCADRQDTRQYLIRVKSSEADLSTGNGADFQRSLTPCAPAAVSPPQRVILSLPSGRLNFRKAIIPDLPEIIDCIFVYGEGQRARRPSVAASLFDGIRATLKG